MALSCFPHQAQCRPGGPLAPRITIDIAIADDGIFDKALDVGPELFDASKSGCDVRIRTNRFGGDLHRYDITATIEEISVDIELTGQVRAWRPKSGHLYFGAEGQERLFAWLPSVPNGLASVRYRIGAEEHRASGSGYHDHNWGDVPMQTLNNWYWAGASVGPTSPLPRRTAMRRKSSTCSPGMARSSLTTTQGLALKRIASRSTARPASR